MSDEVDRLHVHIPRMAGKSQFDRWINEDDPDFAAAQAEILRRFGERESATFVAVDEMLDIDDQ